MILQVVFHTEFSLLPGGLGHFADSDGIPQHQTTIFHPILLMAILLKYLLFQRCHLSRIDEVLKDGDSMMSFVKTSFYTDKIESIEKQDLVPRQRTGERLLIHTPH